MKIIIRVGILLFLVLAFIYITDDRIKENKVLEAPVKYGTAVPVPDKGLGAAIPQNSRPGTGYATFVGKDEKFLLDKLGKPDRIEPSGYGYDWWIYTKNSKLMVGVSETGMINQVFTDEIDADVTPFRIGQDLKEIYRFSIVGSEIDVMIDDNIFTFTLNGNDLKNRLLIVYNDLYAQLYIDQIDGELESVRFIDPHTLVLHQPYDMTYTGDMILSTPPSSNLQMEVDRAIERQVFELTNNARAKHKLSLLKNNDSLNLVAQDRSKRRALENHMSDEEIEVDNLADRLAVRFIEHRKAGENISVDYVDAIEAVHGWLNSPAHRKLLFDKDFTHLGTGAYGKYFTQIFVTINQEDYKRMDYEAIDYLR